MGKTINIKESVLDEILESSHATVFHRNQTPDVQAALCKQAIIEASRHKNITINESLLFEILRRQVDNMEDGQSASTTLFLMREEILGNSKH